MENVTIISHLTPEEWRLSWEDKVVEDTRENMRAYQQQNCFWGHFTGDSDFTICHHKEFEIKGMSLGIYFNGHLEEDERGCRITGKFGKKLTANIFLAMGAVLCIVAMFAAMVRADMEVSIVSAVLLVILLACYFAKPRKGKERILKYLEKISFDASFHGRYVKGRNRKKKKRTMKEKASINMEGRA